MQSSRGWSQPTIDIESGWDVVREKGSQRTVRWTQNRFVSPHGANVLIYHVKGAGSMTITVSFEANGITFQDGHCLNAFTYGFFEESPVYSACQLPPREAQRSFDQIVAFASR